ncbi:TonB-dependent receptor [Caldimonas thermodepolymerans]|jgi:Outer membrane receptor for monomeric catechols|uniref:Catecholate siderophore receptor n=1 Tax=Caldimonas thermodepolymerans TaxID=215580 RepID=A0A2S5T4W8_9BURK|nr:TonB-dependent receptor [Caldimonas thermodepolymerans]PPE70033.1 TonB-dependent siderophore receptor [Caldimonas thermodepolymerans]QPC31774.1 TonB-dependent receptor [Caldimonas thermodepolymerans]RDI01721.1 catecholate siderophore receptor [Caldimonas thermodepolymerans]TCP05859.1 catecholate siderophore receptor [Caldimonas thermodepolymerans]UZG44558.1 TonB-dependent receptor [Caldimonas thermodepolymerans]
MARKKTKARSARPVVPSAPRVALAPLGALAAGFSLAGAALAQQAPAEEPRQAGELPVITVKGQSETEAKETYRATRSGIGKGNQALRDIPQSMTVHTERLMDDRNLDDFRDVLRTTSGVTFQAGETGEEDVRLRGFSLFQAGDIYVDGIRDAALQERDTFNMDRIEVLKGSASMLFGRGSTGGVVNQVTKQPFLMDQHEVEATVGSGKEYRLTGDFNLKTGDEAALRINAMYHDADKWGAREHKKGIAPTYRFGIGTQNEFSIGLYHMEFDNRPLYNHPWVLDNGKLKETLPAKNFYGLANDHNRGKATYGTLSHIFRFEEGGELKTTLRHGHYERDLLASVIRGGGQNLTLDDYRNPDQVLTRTRKGRIGETDVTYLGSVYSRDGIEWLGLTHNVIAGVEWLHEDAKRNNNTFTGQQLTLPTTTVGTPNDGATYPNTGSREMNEFDARTISVFGQDLVELTPTVKLLAGLRYDHFKYDYKAVTGNSPGDFGRTDALWSHRIGLLYQPNDWSSYHVSYGTSFNTSGDTYALSAANEHIKPEESRNFEVGGKFDLFDNRLFVGASLFYTEKHRERNTDPDTAEVLLSGKRHAAGLDVDIAGRITPQWEAFFSYTWIPEARIDKNANGKAQPGQTGAQVEGDRPGLTPKHMASLWTTYRVMPQLRLGAGLNYRGKQNPEGARHVTADAFTTLDLMAEYTINENLSLKFNVNNATDELYADTLYRGFYAPGAPRTYQLSLKATF